MTRDHVFMAAPVPGRSRGGAIERSDLNQRRENQQDRISEASLTACLIVGRRPLSVIDDEHVERAFPRLQLEPQLLLQYVEMQGLSPREDDAHCRSKRDGRPASVLMES